MPVRFDVVAEAYQHFALRQGRGARSTVIRAAQTRALESERCRTRAMSTAR
jgi:hypothetical protein